MKILITGGTGFIGCHLVRKLKEDNHQVFVLTRNKNKSFDFNDSNITLVEGQLNNPDSYKEIFDQGIDIVYHLAAISGLKWGIKEKDYYQANVQTTKDLLENCHGKIKRFIYCSSINAISSNNFKHDPYGRSKLEAEKLVLEYQVKGLETIIIRPAIVYGPGDLNGMMLKLLHLIKNKKFYLIGSGKNIVPFVYIDDVVRAFVKSKDCQKTGKHYEITSPDKLSISQIIEIMSQESNVKPPSMKIPKWFARITAFIFQVLGFLFKTEPLITQHRIDVLIQDRKFSLELIKKDLDFYPRVNFKEGIVKTITWYNDNGYL